MMPAMYKNIRKKERTQLGFNIRLSSDYVKYVLHAYTANSPKQAKQYCCIFIVFKTDMLLVSFFVIFYRFIIFDEFLHVSVFN